MDLRNTDRGTGDAPAGALTAAEESEAAGSWPTPAPAPWRPMCAQCLGILAHPHSYVRADGEDLRRGDLTFTLQEARAAVDAGRTLVLNAGEVMGLYAVTTLRGTACCAAHVYVVANEGGRGFPFRV